MSVSAALPCTRHPRAARELTEHPLHSLPLQAATSMGACCTTPAEEDSSPNSGVTGGRGQRPRRKTPPEILAQGESDRRFQVSVAFTTAPGQPSGAEWKHVECKEDAGHDAVMCSAVAAGSPAALAGVMVGHQLVEESSCAMPQSEEEVQQWQQHATARGVHEFVVVRSFPMSEVRLHDSPESAWIVVSRRVYDVTGFIDRHPGGASIILKYGGRNATHPFMRIHSKTAKADIESFYIGNLAPSSTVAEDPLAPANA
eukprot:TRINITY_DN9268_c0_g3_i1.p1 TRINITY_DN9268_c0_g3~~TRINITY_DN9268_c0_g3_i1.p1  ORF type:complete len:257 (+),score=50.72 TRINITY_DN9268_c0_g3_i1:767-1537(+)